MQTITTNILDIKIYNKSLLKVLLMMDNKIYMLEMLIDSNNFDVNIEKELETSFDNIRFFTSSKGNINFKLIKNKNNELCSITDVTNKILDKFTNESEDN